MGDLVKRKKLKKKKIPNPEKGILLFGKSGL